MLIASRNVNRRSIVNLYCSLDTSREKEKEKDREREKVRNSARDFFLREDLIPRPRGRASIILPVAVGALLRGNKYIEIRQADDTLYKNEAKGREGEQSGWKRVKEEGDGERERGTGRKSTDEEFNERRV